MAAVSQPAVPRDPARPWAPSPFGRLARTHALSVAGDAMFTLGMAGTVFFSVSSFDEARSRTALLLVFTIAPFAVAAPLIGPLLDRARGGRRMMIVALAATRAVLCALLVVYRDSWLLFPLGLGVLVCSRSYLIARGAVVPSTVHNDEELVEANAKLALLSGIAVAVAAAPAGLVQWLVGPGAVQAMASAVFVAATVAALRLPKVAVAPEPADELELAELRSSGVFLAASSMSALRGVVGFVVTLFAFWAKDNDVPIVLGLAAAGAQAGFLVGAATAPRLRRRMVEEHLLAGVLGAAAAVALLAAGVLRLGADGAGVVLMGCLLSFTIGWSSNVGKQAFDSIVQRDAPDANRGRSFARFETRFQLAWVLGALVPVIVTVPLELAFWLVGVVTAVACATYLVGRRRVRAGEDWRVIKVRERLPRRLPVRLPRGLPRWSRQGSGRSMRASHKPGASTSEGVGSSRSETRRRRSVPSSDRSTTPSANDRPRS
jgi:hypothetical protein